MTTTAHEPYIEEKGFSETVLNTVLFIGIITLKAEIKCNSLFMGLLQTQVWHQWEDINFKAIIITIVFSYYKFLEKRVI